MVDDTKYYCLWITLLQRGVFMNKWFSALVAAISAAAGYLLQFIVNP